MDPSRLLQMLLDEDFSDDEGMETFALFQQYSRVFLSLNNFDDNNVTSFINQPSFNRPEQLFNPI